MILSVWLGLGPQPLPAPLAIVDVEARTAVTAQAAIRWCESRDNYRAENPNSTASGAYQAIASTWRAVMGLAPPASAYPRAVQDRFFRALWDGGRGAAHWAPSRDCWEPLLGAAA